MPVIIILIMPTDWEIMFYDTRKNDHILPRGRIKVNVVSDRSTAGKRTPGRLRHAVAIKGQHPAISRRDSCRRISRIHEPSLIKNKGPAHSH
jgi:hypothetical protein